MGVKTSRRDALVGFALVGREPDLALLRDNMSQAAAGHGAVVLVAGETGLGKTRLVTEVEQLCRHSHMLFLCGRGDPELSGEAYGLFAGVLRKLAEDAPPDAREGLFADVCQLAPHLRDPVFPESRERPGPDPVTDPALRQCLLSARLVRRVAALAGERPLVLCLEDVHLADRESLQLLCYLARRCVHQAVLVLLTYRPEEVGVGGSQVRGRSLSTALWELSALPHFQLLRLQHLSRRETRQLMESCCARAEFDEGLVERIHRRTRGIPLLVVESLALLRRRGLLSERGGTWVATDIDGLEFPESMRSSLEQRLQQLSDDERRLVCHAAVQGERFEGAAIAATLDRDLLSTLRTVARLQRRTRLVEACERGFRFAHPLLAEILCQLLSETERRHVHARLAIHLESRHPEDVELLAHHLHGAGDPRGALPYLIASGRRASARSNYREARRFLRRALAAHESCDGSVPPSQKLEILLALAGAEARLGLHEQAAERCQIVLREACEEPLAEGQARLQLAEIRLRSATWPEAVRLSREALAIFTARDGRKAAGWARLRLGEIAIGRCRLAEAVAHLGHAQRLAHPDGLLAAEIQRLLGVTATIRGRYVEAVVRCSKALRHFRELGDRLAVCRTFYELAAVHLAQGQWTPSLACYQAAARLARDMGTADLLARALVGQARAYSGGGRIDAADAACAAARVLMSQTQDRGGLAACALAEANSRRQGAQYAAAEDLLLEWRPVLRALENLLGVAECDRELGLLRRQRGDAESARQCLEDSSRRFHEIGALAEAQKVQRLLAATSS